MAVLHKGSNVFFHASDISDTLKNQIIEGRNKSFPNHSSNNYFYKQVPYGVIVIFDGDKLVSQCSIIYRYINIDESFLPILGVSDAWVDEKYRKKGVLKSMLDEVQAMSRDMGIECNILVADVPSIYSKYGFIEYNPVAQWLRVHEGKNYGVSVEKIKGIMIRSLGTSKPPQKMTSIDFLGELF